MTYDDWDIEDDCHHEDADLDILSGEASCHCGYRWIMTCEEIQREIDHIAAYQEMQERENRRQWWRDLFEPIFGPIRRLKMYIYEWRVGRNFERSVGDDEIPF